MSNRKFRINDICLFVSDFWGSYNYFTNVFGFEAKRFQPNKEEASYCEFIFEDTTVTMWDRAAVIRDAIDQRYLGEGTTHHFMIAIKVQTPDEVTQISNDFKERGAKIIKEPTDYEFGTRAAYFQDFEDNIWEIFAWFEGNGPGLV